MILSQQGASPSPQGASPSPSPQGMSQSPWSVSLSPSRDSDSTIESESGLTPTLPTANIHIQ